MQKGGNHVLLIDACLRREIQSVDAAESAVRSGLNQFFNRIHRIGIGRLA